MNPFLWLAAAATLLAGPIHGMKIAQESGGQLCAVRGQIQIRHPQVKLRNGGADAGGVAVWLMPSSSEAEPPAGALPRGRIEQRDKRFIPHVTVIQSGTEVDFPNRDPFFHNVFSTFDGKTFDLGLYANGESRPVRFNRPGVSYLYCNIHPQMSAVIVTVDTPYFSSSAHDGTYAIGNVPAGRYELHVWHERSDARQLDRLRRVISVIPPVTDAGSITLDEAGYIPKAHKNKHGEDYPDQRRSPYRRP